MINSITSSKMALDLSKVSMAPEALQKFKSMGVIMTPSESYKISEKPKELLLGDISFELKSYPNLKPEDISYEDYKNLTYDALKIIFCNDKKKSGPASGLLSAAQLTYDDTLNKIFFDKRKEEIFHPSDKTFGKYNSTLFLINLLEISKKILSGRAMVQEERKDLFATKDMIFEGFEKCKKYFTDDEYFSNPKIEITNSAKMDIKDTLKIMDEIKAEYEKRVSENNSILNQYTKNSKPNPVESL